MTVFITSLFHKQQPAEVKIWKWVCRMTKALSMSFHFDSCAVAIILGMSCCQSEARRLSLFHRQQGNRCCSENDVHSPCRLRCFYFHSTKKGANGPICLCCSMNQGIQSWSVRNGRYDLQLPPVQLWDAHSYLGTCPFMRRGNFSTPKPYSLCYQCNPVIQRPSYKNAIDVVNCWMSVCICFIQLIYFIDSRPLDAPIPYLSSCSMDKTPEISRRTAKAILWHDENLILRAASVFWKNHCVEAHGPKPWQRTWLETWKGLM